MKKLSLHVAFLVVGSVMAMSRVGYARPAVAPPSISKAFGATTIPFGGTTTLTFTITNPNTSPFTGVAFTDSLPAGLVVATPNGLSTLCGGTATAVAGSGTISLSGGGTLPPLASCTLVVNVTGTTAGIKNNTSGNVSSTDGGTGNTASASITVLAPIVPTLNESGMLIFGLLIAAAGLLLLIRRR